MIQLSCEGVATRRAWLGMFFALVTVPSAQAQSVAPETWVQSIVTAWSAILDVPMSVVRTSAFAIYGRARDERELSEARATAANKRAEMEAQIARCRALVAALPPGPRVTEGWEQMIVDQVPNDQSHALDRLVTLAAFIESNSNDFARGAISFGAAMPMSQWAVLGEVDWIMASSTKIGRVGQAQNGFVDLWQHAATLDYLASSIVRGVYVRIVHGDPPTKIPEDQAALNGVASEMRRISELFAAADQRSLGIAGDVGLRVRRLLPRLSALAEEQAQALDAISRAWPSLSANDLIAGHVPGAQVPSFVRAAGPLVEFAGQPT
jgi:hypothetical protein